MKITSQNSHFINFLINQCINDRLVNIDGTSIISHYIKNQFGVIKFHGSITPPVNWDLLDPQFKSKVAIKLNNFHVFIDNDLFLRYDMIIDCNLMSIKYADGALIRWLCFARYSIGDASFVSKKHLIAIKLSKYWDNYNMFGKTHEY